MSLCEAWADAHSDVWAESQRLRSIIFRSLILKTWRRLFAGAAHGNQPVSNASPHPEM